ncbi:hypothetical protein E0F15_10230 [Frankia sp. B2]|uniref:SCO6880 family protein n=1 Tax=unclassified Frankia TaxID=2632575 RepID=UPI00046141C3|nr:MULTISPECIES: SCO6880 family protein [unclassified Frankia]KDA40860.1 hypothetical protein BMG523Draft_04324 [Frankia sp. BMG5.23]TFE31146.1 hypothetical protein E0F15_10230 [Frankia sp. B2]
MTEPTPVRTYGGWRRARGLGLMGLTTGQTLAALGMFALVLLAATIRPRALLVLGPPLAVLLGVTVARWDGIPLLHVLVQHVRWRYAVLRGWNRRDGGVLVAHPRAWQLPGVLAPMALVDVEDGAGGRYGLVWDRRTGLLTATIRVSATSTWLAGSDADTWTASWGGWLASLGYLPAVRWVAVTVDTAPDPGTTLRDALLGTLDPAAPSVARQLVHDLVASPHTTADVDTRVSITFDPRFAPTRPAKVLDAAVEFSRTLIGLESALGGCGVTVLGRASAAELAGAVRVAFDPARRGEVIRLLEGSARGERRLLRWADAGPVAARETWDAYRHDSGLSTSWGWREAPRQLVHSDVLARLLAPGPWPTRVTMLYRPMLAGVAARTLETEVNAATFRALYRARTGRDATARDNADAAAAARAAREEAQGAGVVLMSLYATVTVDSSRPEDLPKAVADLEARADTAKIRLRRMYGAQAAGFAVTLPCGICPPALATRWPH